MPNRPSPPRRRWPSSSNRSPSQPPSRCSAPNRPIVELGAFNPDHSVIVADLRALLSQNDIDDYRADDRPIGT